MRWGRELEVGGGRWGKWMVLGWVGGGCARWGGGGCWLGRWFGCEVGEGMGARRATAHSKWYPVHYQLSI